MDPIGAVAPKLSPAVVAAKHFNAPFLDPTNAARDPLDPDITGKRKPAGLIPAVAKREPLVAATGAGTIVNSFSPSRTILGE
jgi:hypothetical protein